MQLDAADLRKSGARAVPHVQKDDEAAAARALRCRACQAAIADSSDVFQAAGLFVNPHGFLHELLLVRTARGLLFVGEETAEHTWFAGYTWRIALCARCQSHLGWRYTAAQPELSPSVFYGLRRASVIEP